MQQMNNMRTDLNLLTIFDAVFQNRSVTKAADMLGLSQPAVSHALNRLRAATGDPLFVRSRGKLAPTPRALDMAPSIAAVLAQARLAMARGSFDPRSAARVFRVAMTDYSALTIIPPLAAAFLAQAPKSVLELTQVGALTLELLEAGRLDVSFWGGPVPFETFDGLELHRDRFVGMVSAQHPLARKARAGGGVTLEEYLAHLHARVALEAVASSPVDDALSTIGRSRRIALTAPGFGSVLAILPQSNLVAALPLRLAANTLPKSLALFELPFSVAEIAYQLIWHRRWAEDAGHKWLRSLAEQTAR